MEGDALSWGNSAVNFRAPPPSPVGSSTRRPSFTNEDVLTDFIQRSATTPDLILPDKVFPRQSWVQRPPKLDFQEVGALENGGAEEISRLVAEMGFLEVTNHGISRDLIELVLELGDGIFRISPEKKRAVARSPESRFGFEECEEEEEMAEGSEEFVWNADKALDSEMDEVWPQGYSNFRKEMEKLSAEVEKVAATILQFLHPNSSKFLEHENPPEEEEILAGNVWKMRKHGRKKGGEQWMRYEVIKMLIKGCEFPHALGVHTCSGYTDFHVYSKKGWISFFPHQHSLVITIGHKLQIWSGGAYKHVVGRPVYRISEEDEERWISMSFLYSKMSNSCKVSVSHQVILALLLTLFYRLYQAVFT